jgi:hypothetical protein
MRYILAVLVFAIAACGQSGQQGAGSDTGAGGSDAGTGVACAGQTCGASQYCRSFLWSCEELMAECVDIAPGCAPSMDLACGCDGQVYADDCAAHAAGVDIDGYSPSCTPPEGKFSCGFMFCATGVEYCVEHYESGWSCETLPPGCDIAGATCECFGGGVGGGGGTGPGLPDGCRECSLHGGNFELLCGLI